MSWEPRPENMSRFEELESAINLEEQKWNRIGLSRESARPDLLRLAVKLDVIYSALCELELLDRDEINLTAMAQELENLQRVRAIAEEQRDRPQIILAKPRQDIPRKRP